jgi:hypothetical protein
MADFICKACGKQVDFSLRRGFQVKDQRCSCGGSFGRMDRDTGKLMVKGPSANSGKKASVCTLCGRHVFKYYQRAASDGEHEVFRAADGSWVSWKSGDEVKLVKEPHKRGDIVCDRHYNIPCLGRFDPAWKDEPA